MRSPRAPRVDETTQRFGLVEVIDVLPDALPLSQRQRLSLAVARDAFWRALIEPSRHDAVTIFISTHFMK